MMYPRLKLARTLLRPDGALFVTIDDREVAHLKILMDEIWGDENCVCLIAWQKVVAKKNKALVSGSHDHILVYTKSIDYWSRNLLPRSESQFAIFRNRDQDPRGSLAKRVLFPSRRKTQTEEKSIGTRLLYRPDVE